MPTQVRRGYAWIAVNKFIQSMHIGLYERYPQCPDLLRKSWKYIIELPYVSFDAEFSQKPVPTTQKDIEIFYSGRFSLIGPEIVCSIRNSITKLAGLSGVKIINITLSEYNNKVNNNIQNYFQRSKFCIITKADSYSSSAFYHAINSDCIPIVVSDWFVFAFPWLIPYDDFIVRVSEKDFVKDPGYIVKRIKELYHAEKQKEMLAQMAKWKHLISYKPVAIASDSYKEITQTISSQLRNVAAKDKRVGNSEAVANYKLISSQQLDSSVSIIPFELLLLEMHLLYNNGSSILPCISPFECTTYEKSIYSNGIQFSKNEIPESRSYLCQHNSRIIGHYKMVYFMQCVRVLWPLQPGKLKPIDQPNGDKGLSAQDYTLVMNFHNLTPIARAREWSYPDIYPSISKDHKSHILSLSQT